MIELTADESKKALVGILVKVADFCEKNNIKYSLAYGTLIGAIRHKGFIPWDDDIDIIMLRDDYERFVSLFRRHNDERYQLIEGYQNKNHSHVRVSDMKTVLEMDKYRGQFYKSGLWIDVFPIDKVPDTKKGYLKFKRYIWFLFEMQLSGELRRKGLLNNILYIVCRPFRSFFGKLALKKMEKYNKKNTHTLGNMGLWYLNFPEFPMNYMNEFVDVDFEGYKFKAIKEYDAFLRGVYGDYMQFPPEDKRIAHHLYKAFWKE